MLRWLGNAITIGALTFRHGDNGQQEFYEYKSGDFCCGVFQNHGEKVWIAYAIHGDRVRTLNTSIKHLDGRIKEDPLRSVRGHAPKPLCVALEKLWRKHGARMVELPEKTRRPSR